MILTNLLLLAGVNTVAAKLLIASDSSTATYTNSSRQGWGYFIGEYLSIPVINDAKIHQSTRSFIRDGLWNRLLEKTTSGDYVVLAMGRNDDGDPTGKDGPLDRAYYATLPGTGNEAVMGLLPNNRTETVRTFGWYLRIMIADVRSKRATPIISGIFPYQSHVWGQFNINNAFVTAAAEVAQATGAIWVNHTKYTEERWLQEGEQQVASYFTSGGKHSTAAGARVIAETFVISMRCANARLSELFNSKAEALTQQC